MDIARATQVDESIIDLLIAATGLTRREAEVARLVAGGETPRKISEILKISYETVRIYLKSAFAKLTVHSQAELVALVNRLSPR